MPGSSGKRPLNLGTLGPASSHLQAAQPVPFSDLPKAIGFWRGKKGHPGVRAKSLGLTDRENSHLHHCSAPLSASPPEGVCWVWHSRQPARPLSRPSPSTTLTVCILTRIGRLLKVVFSCRTKQSCVYCCLGIPPWGLKVTGPEGGCCYPMLPAKEVVLSLQTWLLLPDSSLPQMELLHPLLLEATS